MTSEKEKKNQKKKKKRKNSETKWRIEQRNTIYCTVSFLEKALMITTKSVSKRHHERFFLIESLGGNEENKTKSEKKRRWKKGGKKRKVKQSRESRKIEKRTTGVEIERDISKKFISSAAHPPRCKKATHNNVRWRQASINSTFLRG